VRSGLGSVRHSVIEVFIWGAFGVWEESFGFLLGFAGFVRFGEVVVISLSDQKEE
jgi:hypothetical protein